MPASDKPRRSAQPRPEWAKARRIVVKIGSSLLVDRASGELKSAWLATLADDVANLVGAGRQVITLTSPQSLRQFTRSWCGAA
jgi:glutamate 5-kinase